MIKPLIRAGLALALALGVAACGSDDDTPAESADETTTTTEAAAGNVLSITETEYAYAVEGSPKPGALTIEVSNEGKELHMIAMAKLQAGKTLEDAKKLLA